MKKKILLFLFCYNHIVELALIDNPSAHTADVSSPIAEAENCVSFPSFLYFLSKWVLDSVLHRLAFADNRNLYYAFLLRQSFGFKIFSIIWW